jgi:hypothetical protein
MRFGLLASPLSVAPLGFKEVARLESQTMAKSLIPFRSPCRFGATGLMKVRVLRTLGYVTASGDAPPEVHVDCQ